MRRKWDVRFLEVAGLVAGWSKDPSTKVGAVIVDDKNRIISTGYNGYPRGVADTVAEDSREAKLMRTIHAEENALLFASRPLDGCTLYITHPPCSRCAIKIIQTGIATIVTPPIAAEFSARWFDELKSATALCKDAGVSFRVVLP